MLKLIDLKTEYRTNPLGIDCARPRFSWILESDKKNTVQTMYRLIVKSNETPVWDSGEVNSDESVLVEYAGCEIKTSARYHLALTVWDNHGQTAETTGYFETGLMGNFKGNWITHGYEDKAEPCPVYIKDFSLNGKNIKSARMYASALGIYNININGQKTSDVFFAPGWTKYQKRIQYQTYDITELLRENNRLEMTVANGWYTGELTWDCSPDHYGSRTAAWAQIEIAFTDDTIQTILSGDNWSYGTGQVRYAEIYHGQIIDNNFPVKIEGSAKIFDHTMDTLVSQECEPVRITEKLKPVKFIQTPNGEKVFDFGQNLTGFVEVRLNCPEGTTVKIQHAEILDKDGNFYTANLRKARATDTFICSSGENVFVPGFTFHGFRYIKIEGLGDTPSADWFTACVLHTDMEKTGTFECSHKGINRLQQNISWGQRGNFLDIPTDCPQRDERLGWTGDAQMFASTAAYIYNCALFFTKWLHDLEAEQTAEFGVPHVVPNLETKGHGGASSAWSDAATIIPWAMYEAFGDKQILKHQYNSMKGWVEYMRSKAGDTNLWQSGFHYGDWLALDKPEGPGATGATDIYLIASAFYAYSTGILAKTAEVLGYENDVKQYSKLQKDIVAAFQKEYITQTGRLVSETQTACILALHFDLVQPEFRARVLQSLIDNLSRHGNHLTTGFVGTPYLCHTLSDNGFHELAATVFLQEDYPSWLYAVNLGATTIWERWNSKRSDGSLGDVGMNSFNHYSYGSIGSWMYQKLGGLEILEPGYKKIRIAPKPVKEFSFVKAEIKTVYGELSCEWKYDDNSFGINITIPCNTTAVVKLPGKEEFSIGSGSYYFETVSR